MQQGFVLMRSRPDLLPWAETPPCCAPIPKDLTKREPRLCQCLVQQLCTHGRVFQVGIVVGHMIQNICYRHHHGRIGPLLIFIFFL